MKNRIEIKPLILVFGMIISLTVAYAVDPQKCQTVTTTTAGGCSGKAPANGGPCTGTKTITEHEGCTQCVLGTESSDCVPTDNNLDARKCLKRTTVIPCINVGGNCIEGASGAPGDWTATYEKLCK